MARYGGNKECFRIILWMSWVTTVLLTTIYYILNMVVFWKLLQASSELNLSLSQIQGGAAKIWRAPMAACLLGSLLVFGFNLFSCIVLLKKSINRSGPGYGYGFLTAFCFTLAWFTLLCALVLDGFRDTVSTNLVELSSWSKYSTDVYTGAEVFCFVAFAIFIIFFLVLVILQGAVSDQLGIGAEYNPYTRMGDVTVPQALKGPAPGGLPAAPEDSQYDAYNTYGNDANYGNYYQQPAQQGQEAQQGEYQPGEYVATQEYSPQDNYDYNQYNQQYGNSTQYNAYGQDEATQPLAQPIAPPPYEGYSAAPYHPGAAQSARI